MCKSTSENLLSDGKPYWSLPSLVWYSAVMSQWSTHSKSDLSLSVHKLHIFFHIFVIVAINIKASLQILTTWNVTVKTENSAKPWNWLWLLVLGQVVFRVWGGILLSSIWFLFSGKKVGGRLVLFTYCFVVVGEPLAVHIPLLYGIETLKELGKDAL